MDVERASQVIVAQPPRRLRLDELLRELGARTHEVPRIDPADIAAGSAAGAADGSATDTTGAGAAGVGEAAATGDGATADGRAAAATGDGAAAAPIDGAIAARPDGLTVGELVDKAAEAGFGFLIGVLTLIAIPFFGLSTPFGLAIALVGIQLAVGRHRPWLPARARRRQLSMAMLDRVLSLLARRTKWISKSTKRRWEGLIMPRLVGFGMVLLALGLALPLPIPGSNLIFLVPLFVYSIGLLERDGVWIAFGHLGVVIDMGLLVAFGATVVTVLERAFRWLF